MHRWSIRDWLFGVWCLALIAAAWLAIFPGWPVVYDWWWGTSKTPGQKVIEWITGIFTAGAVIVAIYLPWTRDKIQEHAEKRKVVYRVRLLARALLSYAKEVLEADSGSRRDYALLRAKIEEALLTLRTVQTGGLRISWEQRTLDLRALAAQMVETIEAMERAFVRAASGNLGAGLDQAIGQRVTRESFEEFVFELWRLNVFFSKPHPGVSAPIVKGVPPPDFSDSQVLRLTEPEKLNWLKATQEAQRATGEKE